MTDRTTRHWEYKVFFNWDTENIKSTKDLIDYSIMICWKSDWKNISNIANSLIVVKALRALTDSLKENSKSSDRLALVWIIISSVGLFVTILSLIPTYWILISILIWIFWILLVWTIILVRNKFKK